MVLRERLSIEDFHAIRERAEPWLQRAMDLALTSLQRREELVLLRIDEHWVDGRLYVRQQKVEGYGHNLLRIAPGPKLLSAIQACIDSDERDGCPYLIHRTLEKRRIAKGRTHFRQVSNDMPTKAFAEVRDGMGIFKGMPMSKRPSLHEIRSAGADEYRKEGWPEERIQSLLGHSNVEATQLYLSRREERWIDVEA